MVIYIINITQVPKDKPDTSTIPRHRVHAGCQLAWITYIMVRNIVDCLFLQKQNTDVLSALQDLCHHILAVVALMTHVDPAIRENDRLEVSKE